MTAPPPPPTQPPLGQQPQPAQPGLPYYPAQPEGRSVAFWVALLLGFLLLISALLNVVLVVVAAASGATGLAGVGADDDAGYRTVVVAHKNDEADNRILRVPVVGAISELTSPVLGSSGGTVSQVRRALRLAAHSDEIKGVLFDINSPGGGVGDSDEIWRLIKQFREDHPDKKVMALFGDVAASGGYYIAAACERIMSRPTTITGSIGVIISSFDVSKGLDMIGVKSESLISPKTPYKDMLSMTRPMRPDEREKVLAIIEEMYDRFVDIVDQGRTNLTREAVEALANGQIYSAEQALRNGLVDKIVSIEEAYDEMRTAMGVNEAQIVEQRRIPTFADILMGARAERPRTDAQALSQVLFQLTGSKFLYFWPGGR